MTVAYGFLTVLTIAMRRQAKKGKALSSNAGPAASELSSAAGDANQAAGAQQGRFKLLSLPDGPLHHILELCSRRGRLSLMATCKRLKALGDGSATLWADLEVQMADDTPGLEHRFNDLCVWLAASRKRVTCLRLLADVQLGDMHPEEAEAGAYAMYDDAIALSMVVRATLAGSCLETLVLQWPGKLEVAGWVAAMPRLRRLCLYPYHEAAHQELRFTRHLGALRCLEQLAFEADKVAMAPDCLPPSLTMLCMAYMNLDDALPEAIVQATQLRSLGLRDIHADLSSLALLTNLTRLELCSVNTLYRASDQHGFGVPLCALTALRELDIDGELGEGTLAVSRGGLVSVSHLTHLAFSIMHPSQNAAFCAAIGQLTGLRVLDLRYSSQSLVLQRSTLAPLRHLEAAVLPLCTAAGGGVAAALAALPSLQRLGLDGSRFLADPNEARSMAGMLAEVLGQLAASQQLKAVCLDGRAAEFVSRQPELFEAVRGQLAERGIVIDKQDGWRNALKLPRSDAELRELLMA
ncbi:hypothetical protein ABPG75_000996 [Micractinium tetrahymenae]